MKPAVLEDIDKKLLNALQWAFPLGPRPYAALAAKLKTTEEAVIDRIRALKGGNGQPPVIRQISAIFDTRKLGYATSLVAIKVPGEKAEEAAAVLNGHPGVSHNYLRSHDLNIWYTVAVPPTSRIGLERTIEILARECGAEKSRMLPTLRLYKISVKLDMSGELGGKKDEADLPDWPPRPRSLTELEIGAVRELQADLGAEPEPFAGMAERLGVTVESLIDQARRFQEDGTMRRYAAVLHHRSAGFVANCMGVWNVPPDRMEDCARVIMAFPEVSHCYERPVYDDWPYPLYSMIHARSRADIEDVMRRIAEKTGISDHAMLWSLKEYKKVRVPYFTPEMEAWERAHL